MLAYYLFTEVRPSGLKDEYMQKSINYPNRRSLRAVVASPVNFTGRSNPHHSPILMMITGLQWFVCSAVDLFPALFDPLLVSAKKEGGIGRPPWESKINFYSDLINHQSV
jgi:hypothetical protein